MSAFRTVATNAYLDALAQYEMILEDVDIAALDILKTIFENVDARGQPRTSTGAKPSLNRISEEPETRGLTDEEIQARLNEQDEYGNLGPST